MPTCPHRATADFDGIPEWWGFGPLSYVEVHKVDYPWYQQHGIRGISTHASMGWASTGYTSYITSKMWWHPDADVDARAATSSSRLIARPLSRCGATTSVWTRLRSLSLAENAVCHAPRSGRSR